MFALGPLANRKLASLAIPNRLSLCLDQVASFLISALMGMSYVDGKVVKDWDDEKALGNTL
jgi:hypothetical protein